ncbi:diadenylate cyclase CdaA [Mangrovimonas sp. AS39]|uniref:diadenylate cyclase CdaA n=1 Tax=Mangrovimonas TaxID=1211036 RepID=UPI0006B464CD|nr:MULTISPECIES: diadenylate cyclase CdaA [Mangrovimonas]MCF1191526.1 diadenylate cyclase CdaA [Mangrovimonas futianensis]MCF1195221.1 diadenylate cyclase CdaA [Mangrovimonas futianensis]MCF1421100.1 diadenylate cyclase CdaA [Mangrovimonas futianensis]NIK92237.1 TIGR00159 family protein [Mangrovimonas sp. CR14]
MEIFNELLKFTVVDIIDVILVAFLLYYIYKLLKGTVAINIFIGIVIIYFIFLITDALQMKMLSKILGGFMSVGIIALIVVFQPEIRKFLLMIGSTNFRKGGNFFKQFNFLKTEQVLDMDVDSIISACNKMATTKTGALIVLERNNNLDFLCKTGDDMNIKVTQAILESIFFKNSPLHDGAAIISGNIVKATRVILPVNNEKSLPNRFGLRHRAAVGVTEKTDALAIVVSEETGQISYFMDGEFIMFNDTQELIDMIKKDLS